MCDYSCSWGVSSQEKRVVREKFAWEKLDYRLCRCKQHSGSLLMVHTRMHVDVSHDHKRFTYTFTHVRKLMQKRVLLISYVVTWWQWVQHVNILHECQTGFKKDFTALLYFLNSLISPPLVMKHCNCRRYSGKYYMLLYSKPSMY